MKISVGDTLPNATFQSMGDDGPVAHDIKDLTAGKKIVIFGLPGAYTNTCSTAHMPSFVRNAETSTAIPSQITAYRTAVRTHYGSLKTAITNAANVAAVESLYSWTASANSSGSITIDGTSSGVVSTSANSITSNGHGFVVGEMLTYGNGEDGADIGGLVDGTRYYVYSKTVNTFKLSHSHSNCGDAAVISLTGVASSGTSHIFTSNQIPGAGQTWPNLDASIYTV